ncbi:ATP-dependent DNA ligase [Litchfieldia alkalitelluris]|uniref:ATP-dependent DNA ligase n=1 Tax=Litchfieldia alkalitelluris TaxID=304268 RepID=UPI000996403E|nr:RNA ligase family protein [Litchfieldia alkalitelluris]
MFVSPMLLHKSDEPFESNVYFTELKFDGIRLLLSKFDNKVRLYTRHNNDVTSLFKELHDINIPNGTVLDGELIVPGVKGKPEFELMMERFSSNKSNHFIQYVVFDIIKYNSQDLTFTPLYERKQILDEVISDSKHVVKSQYIEGNGVAYFDLIKQQGLEGIVLKNKNSKYQTNKRSHDWLKVINYQYKDVYITGLKKAEFGAVLSFEDGRYLGIMEFMPLESRKRLHSMKKIIGETEKYINIEPVKCNVKYRNLTSKGLLRIPSFHTWIS